MPVEFLNRARSSARTLPEPFRANGLSWCYVFAARNDEATPSLSVYR